MNGITFSTFISYHYMEFNAQIIKIVQDILWKIHTLKKNTC